MKYMVSSEEKPQNFPIYAVHSDMDSFILFNDDIGPTNDDKSIIVEQDLHINEENSALEMKDKQSIDKTVQEDKLNEKQNLKLLMPNPTGTDRPSLNLEILWFVKFDGSVNKLGVGAGVWIHNK